MLSKPGSGFAILAEIKKHFDWPIAGKYTVTEGLDALSAGSGTDISAGLTVLNQEIKKMKTLKKAAFSPVICLAMLGGSEVIGQSALAEANPEIEEQVILGSRTNKARSVSDSPVPVDVFTADQFGSIGGGADITDSLKSLVPSYTATPATGDGSAFIRPTSLRGMAPDQTLVLVNGKRRHRSALVQFFAPAAGNGSHGVDVGVIPGNALKNIQVLRDGAAAQYGSDAIAGVMNFELRDAREGGELQVQVGEHFDGESNFKVGGNLGLPLGDAGFFNVSIEHVDNDALSRGVQRPNAQALIDGGVQDIGADAPFGDTPLVQSWGRPESRGTRLFFNTGYELDTGDRLYAFGNSANTFGRYRFFYRNGDDLSTAVFDAHSSIRSFLGNFGDQAFVQASSDRNTCYDKADVDPSVSSLAACDSIPLTTEVGPGNGSIANNSFEDVATGYTPFLDGAQDDVSLVLGLRGENNNAIAYDFSLGWGRNELAYRLNNTLNPDLAPIGPNRVQRDFEMGGYIQDEINVNADFTQEWRDGLYFSYGAEWRREEFTIVAGEPNAVIGAGTSGLRAASDENVGSHSRSNWAVYADVEQDVSDAWLMQYALRYEDFSDFGDTINGKVATRYSLSDTTNLRAAISTGFHAPTPGQANVETLITTFDGFGGLQLEGLVPPESPAAALVGGAPLKEEESVNLSVGFTTALGFADLTVDAYWIDVSDRIYRTGNIEIVAGDPTQTLSFFTNALDVEHQGIDVVLTGEVDWGVPVDLTFAYSYNKVDVADISSVTTQAGVVVNPVSDSTVEDIENNYPNSRFTFTTRTQFNDQLNLMLRANFYGSHFDERGTIAGSAVVNQFTEVPTGEINNFSAEIGAVIFIDAELAYQLSDSTRLVLGASNLFDEFPDEIPDNGIFANRQSVGLQYPRRTPVNYEGGSYYFKAVYSF